MSSARLSPHRRRSHSVTSPLLPASHQFSTDKWHTACKRQRAGDTRSPSLKDFVSDLPADKWDVDRWRRGKKARRDSSSSLSSARGPCLFGSSPVFREQWAFAPPLSGLPSTSDAFQLFPSRPHQTRNSSYHSSSMSRTLSDSPVLASQPPTDDVIRLRSTAFGELHRSIEESGEGFVSRMRDWEQQHACIHPTLQPEPSTSPIPAGSIGIKTPLGWVHPTASHFDDEDDIQIVSGDLASDGGSESCSAAADSECEMDLDQPDDHSCGVSARYSSPADSSFSGRSEFISDEDSPALSFSSTSTTCSSRISFSSCRRPSLADSALVCRRPTVHTCNSSPSEKAIAALTLVMASGAGGLNDYEAVRASDGQQSSLDESLIGEMWD